MADLVKADLERMGVWRGMLEHFGALRGTGLLLIEEDDEGYGGANEHGYDSGNRGCYSGGGGGGYGLMHGSSQGTSSTSSRAPTSSGAPTSSRPSMSSRHRDRRGHWPF